MAKIILSAFADEIDPSFDKQLSSLQKLGISFIELRGVDGESFTRMSDNEVLAVRDKLKKSNIAVSSLGSPIGKLAADGDFAEHMKLFERIMDIGDLLGDTYPVHRIRFFSFYPAADESKEQFRSRAFGYIEEILKRAQERGYIMCHENEKNIYGESPEAVKELAAYFNGRLRLALDNGNFAFCGLDASYAYTLLSEYIEYFHIKDADADGVIVPPGCGVAHIPELIESIKASEKQEYILTVEPHLCDFTGLAGLAHDGALEHKYSFSSGYEAFEFAVNEIKKMI